MRLAPRSSDAHSLLGWSLREKGKLDDATKEERTALELDANNAVAHEILAAILLLQGKPDEGLARSAGSRAARSQSYLGV